MKNHDILVLGAYGLAGRTVIDGLMALTDHHVVAAGRDRQKLQALISKAPKGRCSLLMLDARDPDALRSACEASELVINTIGPYAVHGARIARTSIESGVSYIDCANEQIHYQHLQELEELARQKRLLMITAAGAIPGFSTLLASKLMEQFPSATSVDIAFAQFRHAYEGAGLASIMSGVLDAVYHPHALVGGNEEPVLLGNSFRDMTLPQPFGKKTMLEVPTIDALTLVQQYPLLDIHSWFYLGDQPAWLFGLIRLLKPHKRQWAYNLIKKIAHFTDAKEFEKAVKAGHGTEALLHVEVGDGNEKRSGSVLLKDGAIPMAYLPVIIAKDYLAGKINHVGLTTPLGLIGFDQLVNEAKEAIIRIDFR